MQPACAQVSAKSILMGALKPKRVFIHPFSHGLLGLWTRPVFIHPFSTLGLDHTTLKTKGKNVNTW
ncbi:unnamed protein product, partial [Brassica rapa]